MTSNRYSYKLQIEFLRRNLILPIISFVGFFFLLPVRTFMYIQNQLYNIQDNRELYFNLKFFFDNEFLVFPRAFIIFIASLFGLLLFRYLHSKKQTDFYHSLPISRTHLFCQLYLTGILSVIPAYLIMYLSSFFIAVGFGFGKFSEITILFPEILTCISFFLFFYSLVIFSTILTGNTFISSALYVFFNFFLYVSYMIFDLLCTSTLKTYYHLAFDYDKLCPFIMFFSNYYDNADFGSLYKEYAQYVFIIALISIVLLILSAILFKYRKSETAGNPLSFKIIKGPLKVYIVIIAGFCSMFLFTSFVNSFTTTWSLFGLFVGVFLSHIFFEMIYNFNVRCAFKKIKTMFALLIICVGIFFAFKSDLIGFDSKVPKKEDVVSIEFDFNIFGSNNSNLSKPLTEDYNISAVLSIAQLCVEQIKNDDIEYNTTYENRYGSFYITYELNNGKKISRAYRSIMFSDEIFSLIGDIVSSYEYLSKQEDSIFTIDLETLSRLNAYISTNNPVYNTYYSFENVEQAKEFINVLKEEFLTLTKEQLQNEIPVFALDLDITNKASNPPNDIFVSDVYRTPIYPSFTKTINLLEKYTNVKPQSLNINDIKNLSINYISDNYKPDYIKKAIYENKDLFNENSIVNVNDRETISKIIENSIDENLENSLSCLSHYERTTGFFVNVVFKDDEIGASTLYYPYGKFPIETIIECFKNPS